MTPKVLRAWPWRRIRHRDKLVWRAVNQGQANSKAAEQQNIDKIVMKTLGALPPPKV
jgi:hypothetical protein